MIKKSIAQFIFAISALLAVTIPTLALAIAPMPPYPGPTGSTINHQYVVAFDGEGEATVAAQLQYTNIAEESIKTIAFTIPDGPTRIVKVFQEYTVDKKQKYCARYDSVDYSKCLQEEETTYPEYKYEPLTPEVKTTSSGTEVTLPLAVGIEKNKTSTVYITYKTFGYATKRSYGLFSYQFKTAQFNANIDRVDVAIYTESDLYLKGLGKGKTEYVPNLAEGIAKFSEQAAGTLASSPFAADFSQAIQSDQYVSVTKYQTNLDPNESYTVSGVYATSWLRLYYGYVLLGMGGVLAFILVIIIGERLAARKIH